MSDDAARGSEDGWLRFPGLARVPGLVHAVTTRAGGISLPPYATLNLGRSTPDDPAAVRANRRAVAERLGFPVLRTLHQVHGRRVVGPAALVSPPPQADAVVLDRPAVLAGVLGADCALLLLVDPVRRVLALAHAGWRGVVAGVVAAAIERMGTAHGTEASSLRVGIGPAICGRCYEVGPEVAQAVRAVVPDAQACLVRNSGDRHHLHLHAALRRQLAAQDVDPGRIETIAACTKESPHLFYSHRRDGRDAGRHALVAGWDPPRERRQRSAAWSDCEKASSKASSNS